MVDGFHWTRVTAKLLRFLYEDVTTQPPPSQMRELAASIDRGLDSAARQSPEAPDKADKDADR